MIDFELLSTLFFILTATDYEFYACGSITKGWTPGLNQQSSGLIRITDSWRTIGPVHPYVNAVEPDPRDPGIFYLATGNGLIKASNRGTQWRQLTNGDMTELQGLAIATPAGPKSFGDKRVKALVSYNGTGPMDRIANDKWGDVLVPVFAASGTNDPGATGDGVLRPWRWRIGAYDLAGSKEKYAVSIAMGDHYFGGLICREGAGGKPDPDGLSFVNGASTAFLDAYLNGNAAAKKFLRSADLPALTNNRAFLERS